MYRMNSVIDVQYIKFIQHVRAHQLNYFNNNNNCYLVPSAKFIFLNWTPVPHTFPLRFSGYCTLPDRQCGGVNQKQQDVVEKALEHRRVGVKVISQVFAGQTDGTD